MIGFVQAMKDEDADGDNAKSIDTFVPKVKSHESLSKAICYELVVIRNISYKDEFLMINELVSHREGRTLVTQRKIEEES